MALSELEWAEHRLQNHANGDFEEDPLTDADADLVIAELVRLRGVEAQANEVVDEGDCEETGDPAGWRELARDRLAKTLGRAST